jgi:gamma-glutamyltranspeptidase/glutathione hydrolase
MAVRGREIKSEPGRPVAPGVPTAEGPRACEVRRASAGLASRLALVAQAFLLLVLAWTPAAVAQRWEIAPEAASGWLGKREPAVAQRFMVSAANPAAVEAGLEMLRAGGTAVDAAIAVQLVLGLVEPQSSGLGGGAFLLHWDERARSLTTWDGRETAPAAAKPDRFLVEGRPIPFVEAVRSGASVGVPGLVRLLDDVHRVHGRLPWGRLFAPAIRLAEEGFLVSARLHVLLTLEGAQAFSPAARSYFFDEVGSPRPAGARLTNPGYAATLRRIAEARADGFYAGETAEAIVAAVAGAERPGDLTRADLAGYRTVSRPPLCSQYRSRRICGMAPPSSGGLAVAQTLALLEAFDLGQGRDLAMRPAAMHLIAEAQKLAYADRDRYVADPGFVPLPDGLLDPAYIANRRLLVSRTAPMARPAAGVPDRRAALDFGDDETIENVGTSHVSIIDADGNAVSLTTTIEGAFGSRLFAAGFLLNNQLTDFSFRPADREGRAIANRVEAGKRPRSTMAPTIVFDAAGRVESVLGSPGGGRIILYVTKALIGLIDWQLDPQAAAALPNFGSRGGAFEIELDPSFSIDALIRPWVSRPTLWYALAMRAMGHEVMADFLTSGLHIVQRKDGRLLGGADPRREGVAAGD